MPADEASDPFLDAGRLFPDDVEPLTVAPLTPVTDALKIMATQRFSQLPVVAEGRVRGVFSHWSLTRHLIDHPKLGLEDVAVEDVMEQLPTVSVRDSLQTVLEHFERHDAVLVVSPHGLQAVATSTDALRYFYQVARPFVLLQEIELALRQIVSSCVTGAQLRECIEGALAGRYRSRGQEPPGGLEEMSLDEYRTLIVAKSNWAHFDGILGHNRRLVDGKLERVRRIRNQVFHFRASISVDDYETLAATRDWLFDKDRTRRPDLTDGERP